MRSIDSDVLAAGAAGAGLIYLIFSAVQALGIYKLCRKQHYSTAKTIALTVLVFIPFGLELALLIVAYAKDRQKHSHKEGS